MAPDEDEQSELDEIEQLRSSPLRVLGITFPPDLKTRSEKVLREFKPTISARTLEEVLKCTDETLVNLEDLGVFHEIDAEIVQGRSTEPGSCGIKLTAREMARWGFKVLAHVTMDARVVTQANAKLRNLTGYADHHTIMFQYGGHTRHDMHGKDLAYKLRFARIFGRPLHSQLTLHRSNNDCRYESSYNELVRGTNFDLISSDGRHTGGYELSWLQLSDPSRGSPGGASKEVQSHMGDHVRSAVHYTFCHDARERSDTGLLHSGHAMRLHAAVAGLSPDDSRLQHMRATADMQHVLPLSEAGALVIDTSCGLLMPILGCLKNRKETLISERFHLGGIAYLRGFQYKGLGDRAPRRAGDAAEPAGADTQTALTSDALGGDIFARVRAAVNFSLPGETLQRMGVHGHVFADTGSVAKLFGKEQTVSDGFSRFWNEWRLSFGAGIRIPFTAQGFFELNYVQTLKKFGKDLPAPGLQFGFAAEPYNPIPPRHL